MDEEQTEALLEMARAEGTPLGKRDYALLLAVLSGPLRYKEARNLRWGDLTAADPPNENTVWVRRSVANAGPTLLDPVVYAAMRDYLQAAGRLGSMQAEDYIFAPLRSLLNQPRLDQAETWDGGRPLGIGSLDVRLKAYAERAGLASAEVNWNVLRNTAVFLYLKAGKSHKEMCTFFNFRHNNSSSHRTVKRTLKGGQKVRWKDQVAAEEAAEQEAARAAAGKHGFYTPAFSAGEQAQLATIPPSGVDSEVTAVRVAMLRAMQQAVQSSDLAETLHLLDSISSATQRLASALKVQRELNGDPTDELQAILAEVTREMLRGKGWE